MSKPHVHMLHNKLVLLRSARNFSRKCQISENIKTFLSASFLHAAVGAVGWGA